MNWFLTMAIARLAESVRCRYSETNWKAMLLVRNKVLRDSGHSLSSICILGLKTPISKKHVQVVNCSLRFKCNTMGILKG